MENSGRNTRSTVPKKARNWCFTLNNPTEEIVAQLHKQFLTQKIDFVFQEEKGKSGTPHLQGLLCFQHAKSFATIKKLMPTAHIEVCRNKIASMQYCSKEDTRDGRCFTNMDLSNTSSKKDKRPLSERIAEDLALHPPNWDDAPSLDLFMGCDIMYELGKLEQL